MTTSPASTLPLERDLEQYRRPLTGYCYRLLGSGSEAEDAVQETLLRAWRNADGLKARGALKAWLYRIASNVCFDMLDGAQRRHVSMDLGPASAAGDALGAGLPESAWVTPVWDERIGSDADPAARAEGRETLRLAFVAALQHLPPRQRAVLVLREVLRWRAAEVGELLDMSVASVNSALQRARATLADLELDDGEAAPDAGADDAGLLDAYVDAFEAYDMDRLVALLREDAAFTMPPFPLWLSHRDEVPRFMCGTGAKCEGSRLLKVSANGGPAAAIYNATAPGVWEPWAIVVIETSGGRISGLHHHIFGGLFERFGLPPRLEA